MNHKGKVRHNLSQPVTTEAAQRNRERLPRFAAWLDTIRAFDPDARVLWAEDGDVRVGNKPEGANA